jgi:ribokinase
VTLGAAGVTCVRGSERLRVAGFPVQAVDTVGAGDAFNGALAALLAARASIGDAALVAAAAGALTCTRRGAVAALPSRAEVEALLARSGRRPVGIW